MKLFAGLCLVDQLVASGKPATGALSSIAVTASAEFVNFGGKVVAWQGPPGLAHLATTIFSATSSLVCHSLHVGRSAGRAPPCRRCPPVAGATAGTTHAAAAMLPPLPEPPACIRSRSRACRRSSPGRSPRGNPRLPESRHQLPSRRPPPSQCDGCASCITSPEVSVGRPLCGQHYHRGPTGKGVDRKGGNNFPTKWVGRSWTALFDSCSSLRQHRPRVYLRLEDLRRRAAHRDPRVSGASPLIDVPERSSKSRRAGSSGFLRHRSSGLPGPPPRPWRRPRSRRPA